MSWLQWFSTTMTGPSQKKVTRLPLSSFTDFTGKFVFHCHVLHHEDHGMMSVVEVVDPEAQDEPTNGASGDPDHGDG